MCVLSRFSHVQLFATRWTIEHQALLSMGFSRREYWSGLPFPPPGGLPDPGIKPMSLASPALAGRFPTTSATGEAQFTIQQIYYHKGSFEYEEDQCFSNLTVHQNHLD